MAVFAVYRKPDAAPDDVVLVREGFSWPAFAFTALWALSRKLIAVGLLLLVVYLSVHIANQFLNLAPAFVGALGFALSLLCGFEAATLRSWSLRRAGYQELGLVTGSTVTEAELAYFCSWKNAVAHEKGAAESSFRALADGHDTLGLFGSA